MTDDVQRPIGRGLRVVGRSERSMTVWVDVLGMRMWSLVASWIAGVQRRIMNW